MNRALLSIPAILILLITGTIAYNVAVVDGREGVLIKLSTPLGFSVDWRRIEVQAVAIHGGNGSLITLFTGFLSQPELFLNAQEPTFRDVLESWIPMHVESLSTCLMLDVWIFLENGTVLETRPPIGVPIHPLKALEELVQRDIALNPQTMIKQCPTCQQLPNSSEKVKPVDGPIYECGYEWWSVSGYCYYSGWTDVPILIVANPYANSGVIGWYIDISTPYESTFRITVSYGTKIIAQAPNVDLVTYNLVDWSISEEYIFGEDYYTRPESSHWIYIRAKFAHVHQKKYWVCRVAGQIVESEPTDDERIEEYVYSLQLEYGNRIVGGYKSGLPPQSIMNWFYDGTQEELLSISGTPLSDGDLDVGEYIYFKEIFNCYDQYNEDFEIGIPVGALVATFAGLQQVYLMLLSPIMISLSYGQSYTIDVKGKLSNWGEDSGYGYDIYEIIFMRISKYRYTSKSGYTYKVPAGIYFRCV